MSKFKFNIKEPNLVDTKGWTALHYAAANGKHVLTAKLILNGADLNLLTMDTDGLSPLILAINNHDLKMVNLLLHYGASPNLAIANGNTPFMISIQKTEFALEMCKSLVNAGANVSVFAEKSMLEPGKTKMEIVCQRLEINNEELIKSFVELVEIAQLNKIDPIISESELINAQDKGDNDKVLKFFKDARISDEEKYRVNLFVNAGLNKNMILMLELIKAGYDLNKLDSNGYAPIHHVMYDKGGNGIMLMLLLSNGAIVDIRSIDGKTASEMAIEKGMYISLNLLMGHGAKTNILTSDQIPLLQKVMQSELNMARMLEVLVKHCVDIQFYSQKFMEIYAGDIIDPASVKLMQAAQLADSFFHVGEEFNIDKFIEIKQYASVDFMYMFGTRLNALITLAQNYKGNLDPQLTKDIAYAKQLIADINWQSNDIFESELKIAKSVPWASLTNMDSTTISNIITNYAAQCINNQSLHQCQQPLEDGDHLSDDSYDESPLAGEKAEHSDDS